MSGKSKSLVPIEQTDGMIRSIRGTWVILDSDLAKIYGVPTFRFNEAIKRNRHRFPADFMFQLTRKELDSLSRKLRCQKPVAAVGALSLTRLLNMVLYRQQMFFAARDECMTYQTHART